MSGIPIAQAWVHVPIQPRVPPTQPRLPAAQRRYQGRSAGPSRRELCSRALALVAARYHTTPRHLRLARRRRRMQEPLDLALYVCADVIGASNVEIADTLLRSHHTIADWLIQAQAYWRPRGGHDAAEVRVIWAGLGV